MNKKRWQIMCRTKYAKNWVSWAIEVTEFSTGELLCKLLSASYGRLYFKLKPMEEEKPIVPTELVWSEGKMKVVEI